MSETVKPEEAASDVPACHGPARHEPDRRQAGLYDDRTYSVHAIHMVRTAMTNHAVLSQMADHKANILMGVTFLVFTLSVSAFGGGNYRVSLLILVLSAFLSALFAMAAVTPKVTPPKLSDDELDNLLFFGVFTGLPQEEFIDRAMQRAETDGRVLSTMLRDIYQNGVVLQRKKYRYLSYAFRTFRIGLVLAFAAFVLEAAVPIF
ncbi:MULTISPECIES: Pycsar system effector family protein [unclassified Novosphingobium]|jgi:hypothetical protein|uniref:Pycsar system effector family protein n=1 Tax=unclassified Novosphingobium TaxID=2644732 RepID=UPI00020EE8B1|nr:MULTISPECIES: Pycsar system effector family protein [unclassified Novosphingobium]GFM28418.1 putative uncharacterized protein [Novosphingobium sp. PY1]CCA91575.1 conserved hypothetical protein [Novosphingobium sp. PP1Y]